MSYDYSLQRVNQAILALRPLPSVLKMIEVPTSAQGHREAAIASIRAAYDSCMAIKQTTARKLLAEQKRARRGTDDTRALPTSQPPRRPLPGPVAPPPPHRP
jgi:hypothetical protein